MNNLMHNAINKFHNINLRCGTLALELESGGAAADEMPQFKKRLGGMLHDVAEDLKLSHQFLEEIVGISRKEMGCYVENEHFFKMIMPALSVIEEKKLELENVVNEDKVSLPKKEVIRLLHVMEEKALACGIVLKELRECLIKSGKYDLEGLK